MKNNILSFIATGLAGLLVSASNAFASAQANGIPGSQDYALFSHFITVRNIFNLERPAFLQSVQPPASPIQPAPRIGSSGIQLVGTMSYEKGMFAFFGGNRSDLGKVLPVGDKIADYTITEIAVDFVRLESADKKQQPKMKVGDGLRQDNGKWVYAQAGDLSGVASAPETTGSSSTSSAGATPATPASVGEPNDVLKRLMQLREKENQWKK